MHNLEYIKKCSTAIGGAAPIGCRMSGQVNTARHLSLSSLLRLAKIDMPFSGRACRGVFSVAALTGSRESGTASERPSAVSFPFSCTVPVRADATCRSVSGRTDAAEHLEQPVCRSAFTSPRMPAGRFSAVLLKRYAKIAVQGGEPGGPIAEMGTKS